MGDYFFRHKVKQLFADAGITIDGRDPWDITVHDNRFYRRVLLEAHLGAGESYMDGWWDCPQLDEFFYRILRAGVEKKSVRSASFPQWTDRKGNESSKPFKSIHRRGNPLQYR